MTPKTIAVATAMHISSSNNAHMTGMDWFAIAGIAAFILFVAYVLTKKEEPK